MLPRTGVYVIYVGLHRRKTTGNRLCPACHDSPSPACFQASRWKGCLGGRNDDRNGLLLSLWPLIVLARAASNGRAASSPLRLILDLAKTKGNAYQERGRCSAEGQHSVQESLFYAWVLSEQK